MAREDSITKNDAKYIINLAIAHIEKEKGVYPYGTVLEMLFDIKKDIDVLEPEEPFTPYERDGHNYKEIYIDSSNGYAECYCTKCGQIKNIKF